MDLVLMDFMLSVISGLEREHRFGTSRVHRSTLRAFISYVRRPLNAFNRSDPASCTGGWV